MMTERALVDAIFRTVLEGTDGDIEARRNGLWVAGITLLADVLLSCRDELERERLLNGLWREFRAALDIRQRSRVWLRQYSNPPELTKNGTQMTELGL